MASTLTSDFLSRKFFSPPKPVKLSEKKIDEN